MRKAVRSSSSRTTGTGGRRGDTGRPAGMGRRGEGRGRRGGVERTPEGREENVGTRHLGGGRPQARKASVRGRDNSSAGGRRSSTAPGADRVKARLVTGRTNERELDTETTANDYVSGRHPVLEALKANRPINKILVSESSEGGSLNEILGKARAKGIVVQRVPKANLSKVAGEHHQGIVAYVAPTEYVELSEITKRKTGAAPLVVLLDEISDPYNLGAILRSAEATGVQGVVIPKRRAVPLTGVVAKAAAGALEYVPVARVTNLVAAMEELKKAGYWIVGTDLQTDEDYTGVDYKGPTAIVIGAEGQGLSRLVKERCDYVVKMPMLGKLQSLNASVAAGVLLYEVVRQRKS